VSARTRQELETLFRSAAKPVVKSKGIPAVELFDGQELPPNIALINYRKKRWGKIGSV